MFIQTTKWSETPTYICDKCGRKITSYRPMRLTLKEYENTCKGHQGICNYDLCNRCYAIFDKWVSTKPTRKEEK